MGIVLDHVALPAIEELPAPPAIARTEYETRVQRLYDAAGRDWVVVYGDREHWGNLSYLTGFDPRFEEAVLLIGPRQRRVLVVGNEGVAYARLAGLPLEVALCQTLSLMGQQRDRAPRLDAVLADVGLRAGDQVGIVGWKYVEPAETDDPMRPAFVPVHVEAAIQRCTGGSAEDVTALLMHPQDGQRARNSSAQIAGFEWAAARAARAMLGIVASARPGVTEYEAAAGMGYRGEPLSAHVMFASGRDQLVGLRSPTDRTLQHGDGVTSAIGYWGGLTCRAGILSDGDGDGDDDFVRRYAMPYFEAIATWYASVRVGAVGGEVFRAVYEVLATAPFKPFVNPGHLIALEEWLHTPFRDGSADRLQSGMALQSDIIPSPMPPGRAVNCEDCLVLADATLRAELQTKFPNAFERIMRRQGFMRDALGIPIADDVLPLSGTNGYLFPFWLNAKLVFRVER